MFTLSEFEKAMSNSTKNMTDKFEFVGFDACLMASIEVANTFVPYAEFMIASEESESGEGWNYTAIANKLAENPDCDVVDLGMTIIDSFMQTNIENCTEDIATLSMIDLLKIDTKNPMGLYRSGLMYIAQHDAKNAEEYFKKALEYDPNLIKAKYNLALIYESNNRDKAKELYIEVLEQDPTFVEAKNALADLSSSEY